LHLFSKWAYLRLICVEKRRSFQYIPYWIRLKVEYFAIKVYDKEMLELNVKARQGVGSKASRKLIKKGFLPCVLYGRDIQSVNVAVSLGEFDKVWREAGESSLIKLGGLDANCNILIRAVDIDPVADIVRHADFYAVAKGQKVSVYVPIEFEGVSPAVKELGGTLVKVMHELEVEAEPQNLPHSITADISKLTNFETQLIVADLALPTGVEALVEKQEVVALVNKGVEEVFEESTEIDLSIIEVENKKAKKEDDDDEAKQGKKE
jgi:large subunit ribosomal protein L25